MYEELSSHLDDMLMEFDSEKDPRFESFTDAMIERSIQKSEDNLDKEYQKIEQIRTESLIAAMNEQIVYI